VRTTGHPGVEVAPVVISDRVTAGGDDWDGRVERIAEAVERAVSERVESFRDLPRVHVVIVS
jgi:hypothetical protein